jgi:hypothetical protein
MIGIEHKKMLDDHKKKKRKKEKIPQTYYPVITGMTFGASTLGSYFFSVYMCICAFTHFLFKYN